MLVAVALLCLAAAGTQILSFGPVGAAQARSNVSSPSSRAPVSAPVRVVQQVANGPIQTAEDRWARAELPYGDLIVDAARREGLDALLLAALLHQESRFRADAISAAGAAGLAQLMPATARWLGVTDPLDPAQAIDGGARFLAGQLLAFGGSEQLALAAYNAGPNAVRRHGGVPPYPQTRRYVVSVLAIRDGYRRLAAQQA